MKKKAQGLLEYILIFAFVAVIVVGFTTKFDLKIIRNHVFDRPASNQQNGTSTITLEPMTN